MPPLCHSATTPDASGACEISDLVKGTQPELIAMAVSSGTEILLLPAVVAARQSRVRDAKFGQQLGLAAHRVRADFTGEVRRVVRADAPRVVFLQAETQRRVAARRADVDRLAFLPQHVDAAPQRRSGNLPRRETVSLAGNWHTSCRF